VKSEEEVKKEDDWRERQASRASKQSSSHNKTNQSSKSFKLLAKVFALDDNNKQHGPPLLEREVSIRVRPKSPRPEFSFTSVKYGFNSLGSSDERRHYRHQIPSGLHNWCDFSLISEDGKYLLRLFDIKK